MSDLHSKKIISNIQSKKNENIEKNAKDLPLTFSDRIAFFQNNKEPIKEKKQVIKVISNENKDFIKSLNKEKNQKENIKQSKPIKINSSSNNIKEKIEGFNKKKAGRSQR